jgi:hypothetical protein
MLQVYPDLFSSQTPPPVSAEEFSKLPSFRFAQSELGKLVLMQTNLEVERE